MTKNIDGFSNLNKTYVGEMTLGSSTPSYDLETEIKSEYKIVGVYEADIEKKLISIQLEKVRL